MKKTLRTAIAFIAMTLAVLSLAACGTAPQPQSAQAESPEPASKTSTAPPEADRQGMESPVENPSGGGVIRIRFTFDGQEAVAVLDDNSATQSLLVHLPAAVTISDYADAEKIAYFSGDLSGQNAPEGYDPQAGDVTCYAPWGNMAIFYKDQPYASGLIPMGRIESGLDALSALSGDTPATVERVE